MRTRARRAGWTKEGHRHCGAVGSTCTERLGGKRSDIVFGRAYRGVLVLGPGGQASDGSSEIAIVPADDPAIAVSRIIELAKTRIIKCVHKSPPIRGDSHCSGGLEPATKRLSAAGL